MKTLARLVCGMVLSVSVSLVGCGDDSGSSGSSGSKNPLDCMTSGSSSGTCKAATDYANCIETKCATQYKKCFGSDYKSGKFGGVCASYLQCFADAKSCTDNNCGLPSGDCQTCLLNDLGSCQQSSGCTPASCDSTSSGTGGKGSTTTTGTGGKGSTTTTGTGGKGSTTGSAGAGSSSGTCDDLMACCNKATNAQIKSACQMAYDSAKSSGDAICGMILSGIKASACP